MKATEMSETPSCKDLKKQIRELEQRLSESKHTINLLQNTDHAYKAIFNAANDAIVIHDPLDGRVLDVNQKMLEMYGYTYDEALGLDFQAISEGIPPYSQAQALELAKKAALGSAQIFEWKARHKRGDLFWVEVNLKRVVLGGADRTLAIVRDITSRKKADEKIRKSEEQFRTLTELSHVGTFLDDAQGNAIYINPRCAEIVGVPVNKALNLNWVQYLHPDDRERVVSEWTKAVKNKDAFKQEYRYVHSDGRVVWTRGETTPVKDSQGQVSVFIGTMIDITALKQAEKELRQNEALLRELFDNIEIGAAIFETQDDGQSFILKELNRYGLETGQVKKEAVIGREVRDVFPEIVEIGLFEVFQTAWKTGHPRRHTSSLYKDDRIMMWVENYVSRLPSGQLVTIYEDITDKRQAQADRDALEKQLAQAQKMESIGRLAGGIAHDFNNILSGIFGFSQLAKNNLTDPGKAQKNIDHIIKGAQKATDLVQQILTVSRKSSHEKQPVSVYMIVEEALKLLRATIPSTIKIQADIASRATVMAEPDKMHQIIMNLCTNAYHAMSETGGRMVVTLKEVVITREESLPELNLIPGHYLDLIVSDTGIGMDSTILKKIFDPYFTTKEQGKGTGLGLALVFGIVKEFKGDITVHSEPGQGSIFHVYLPIIDEPVVTPIPEKEEETTLTGEETIMFVDDEEALRNVTHHILEGLGYTVHTFSNGTHAFETYKNNPNQFDLVVTDMTMPGMTGLELLKKILKLRPEQPVAICTGYSDLISSETAMSLGISAYFEKPIVTKELAKVIRNLLDEPKNSG